MVAFTDNDSEKWGGTCCGISVIPPTKEHLEKFDTIMLCCVQAEEEIKSQLKLLGIADSKIECVKENDYDIAVRTAFYSKMKQEFCERGINGSIAELGVFRGDEAKILNSIFRDRTLHLFDTFEGFDIRDIDVEHDEGNSFAKEKQFNDTSINIVKEKLEYPSKVIFHKGYFPDTWIEIRDVFALVRIDMDLYQPTVSALNIFHERMVSGGVILLHDYYGDSYIGIKKAVDDYLILHEELIKIPIGDSLSCLIVGY